MSEHNKTGPFGNNNDAIHLCLSTLFKSQAVALRIKCRVGVFAVSVFDLERVCVGLCCAFYTWQPCSDGGLYDCTSNKSLKSLLYK